MYLLSIASFQLPFIQLLKATLIAMDLQTD